MNVCVYVCVFLRMYKKAREREREIDLLYVCIENS